MNSEPKIVKCPSCKVSIEYSLENKFRPFCSERCKILDLGDWASQNFRIPGESTGTIDPNLANDDDTSDDAES